MSRRRQIQRRLETLRDVGGIMGAMRNISLMETHKLARFLAHQHRVLAGIEAAGADFLGHHPEFAQAENPAAGRVIVAIGSQRGFCGDFNDALVEALRQQGQKQDGTPSDVLVVGRRLAAKLGRAPRVAAAFDGASVAEEVPLVLERVMRALGDLQARAGGRDLLAISVLAHREGEGEGGPSARSILPAPPAGDAAPRFPYPALLNLTAPAFFAELARHYLWAQMHDAFYGSLMAENRRRLRHMEGAMQRMEEKAADLQRRYNLLRQEEITEEIEVIMLSDDGSNEARRPSNPPHSPVR